MKQLLVFLVIIVGLGTVCFFGSASIRNEDERITAKFQKTMSSAELIFNEDFHPTEKWRGRQRKQIYNAANVKIFEIGEKFVIGKPNSTTEELKNFPKWDNIQLPSSEGRFCSFYSQSLAEDYGGTEYIPRVRSIPEFYCRVSNGNKIGMYHNISPFEKIPSLVVPAKYGAVEIFDHGYWLVKDTTKSLWGVLVPDGREIVPVKYPRDQIYCVENKCVYVWGGTLDYTGHATTGTKLFYFTDQGEKKLKWETN
jgi:hypothetical protein